MAADYGGRGQKAMPDPEGLREQTCPNQLKCIGVGP
jgi:hypothetical protein